MSELLILEKNTMLLTLDRLKNEQTGDFENGATVAGQLKDSAGGNIGGSITLTYVTASEGKCQGSIPDNVGVSISQLYKIEVSVDAGGSKGFFNPRMRVEERTD